MTRFKLVLEYHGGGFVGWQRQATGIGVQQAVEEAVHAFSGEHVRVMGAGRTDSGVHALGQVAHVDIAKPVSAATVRDALNHFLSPRGVAVLHAHAVGADFHARFAASERGYRYRILNRRPPPALDRGRVWWVPQALDAEAMHAGARHLLGKHDFTSFRASECQADSPVRTLDHLAVERADDEVVITARALSFLHHQIRVIAGTLKLVGQGTWSSGDVALALTARDRAAAGPTAPAHGLYLTHVGYPGATG